MGVTDPACLISYRCLISTNKVLVREAVRSFRTLLRGLSHLRGADKSQHLI